MSPRIVQWTLIGIVAGLIVYMAPPESDDTASSLARPAKQRASSTASVASSSSKQPSLTVGRVELERLARLEHPQNEDADIGNAFNTLSWYQPAPAPKFVPVAKSVPLPPPVPTAPPMPFTYLGRYNDEASLIVILSKGERVYTVAVGDVIENTYRVEKLSQGVVVLTYLPLKIEQSLRTGEAS